MTFRRRSYLPSRLQHSSLLYPLILKLCNMEPRAAAANVPSSPLHDLRQSMFSTSSMSDFVHGSPLTQQSSQRSKTGRRTWRSLKEKKEAVWPEHLEEALLEGKRHVLRNTGDLHTHFSLLYVALERYRPTSSKDPSSLRRFPKRNAFISNYIKAKTKTMRTPKQVGSRLQQLRETCTEERGWSQFLRL